MFSVCTTGELLVEIMRSGTNQPLDKIGQFTGPFPSGAPAIFIDAMSQWGASAKLISAVGEDAFGDLCLQRMIADGVDITDVTRIPGFTTGMAFVNYKSDGAREFLFHAAHSALSQMKPQADWEERCQSIDLLHITGSSLLLHPAVADICLKMVAAVYSNLGPMEGIVSLVDVENFMKNQGREYN